MYNQSYEEYMRSILGYTYNPNYNMYFEPTQYTNNQQLEECYPEIYKIVYPMVVKACMENKEPVTKELVDKMTYEIYTAIEVDNEINININLQNNVKSQNMQNSVALNRNAKEINGEPVREDRRKGPANKTLNDLIRILILRELLNRPNNPPYPRPGFPGGVGPSRPPFLPRDFENEYMQ